MEAQVETIPLEEEAYLVSLPEHLRRLAEKLRLFGLTIEEIQEGFRHPDFPIYVAKILSATLCGMSIEEAKASIRKVLEKISGLSPQDIANRTERHHGKKRSGKTGKTTNPNTLRRLSVLAALYEKTSLRFAEIEKLALLKKRALRSAIKVLVAAGYIEVVKEGKIVSYRLTHSGVTFLVETMVQEFQCELQDVSGSSHKFSCTRLLEVLRKAVGVTEKLRYWGWYAHCVKEVFKLHALAYILALIERIGDNPEIDNPGAYLYAVLFRKVPDERRKEAIVRRVLEKVPVDIVKMYQEEAGHMTCRQALALAMVVRKMANRKTLIPGDVMAFAGWARRKVSYA
jgi:DNA-binding MarR family transcriptional regulator